MPSAARGLRPCVHDEDVVDGRHGDGVDALRLDLLRLLDVARQVVAVAGRREGAGHRDEHHLAALEHVVRRLRRRPSGVMTRKVAWGRRSPTWIVIGSSPKRMRSAIRAACEGLARPPGRSSRRDAPSRPRFVAPGHEGQAQRDRARASFGCSSIVTVKRRSCPTGGGGREIPVLRPLGEQGRRALPGPARTARDSSACPPAMRLDGEDRQRALGAELPRARHRAQDRPR